MGSKYESERYMVKAVAVNPEENVIKGFLIEKDNNKLIQVTSTNSEIIINPYTICKNTGIKINDMWVYEYDLFEVESLNGNKELGFIEFDSWDNSWKIRRSLNYTSKIELKRFRKLIAVGNILLFDADFKRMQKYSDEQEKNYSPQIEPECRSNQHRNKKAKEFLPR